MVSTTKLSLHNTKVTQEGSYKVITYHSTPVVKFNIEEVRLNFGNWDTVTTRRKMNQVSWEFGLNYSVFRIKGNTFIRWRGQDIPYTGEVILLHREDQYCPAYSYSAG